MSGFFEQIILVLVCIRIVVQCSCQIAEDEKISLIQSFDTYLNKYFEHIKDHQIYPESLEQTSPIVAQTCFNMTGYLTNQVKELFITKAEMFSSQFVVRKDDILGLLFYGSLVTCCSNLGVNTAKMYRILHNEAQRKFVLKNLNLFYRTNSTPLVLSPSASQALNDEVKQWNTNSNVLHPVVNNQITRSLLARIPFQYFHVPFGGYLTIALLLIMTCITCSVLFFSRPVELKASLKSHAMNTKKHPTSKSKRIHVSNK